MNRTLVILLFASITSLFAQSIDSVTVKIKIFPDTTLARSDSILTRDSLLISIKRDSIAPIYSSSLTEKSFIIKNNELVKLDYKYTGEYLKLFPFNFIKDLGFTGQPNETFLYGIGNNAINYLTDGVSINDRFSNSFNLNLIQSEDVDSIEIVPLPRGFLYGAYNNPVSVNFITKDFITSQPYSRIRFYQSANRDMMLDGSFNAIAMKKLIASFSITNRITDSLYDNTEYALWQGKFKLKYLLSNDINIIATYNYNDYKAGYSGGVDVDSIIRLGKIVDDVLYDFRAAPMFNPSGELKTLTHLPRLRFLINPLENVKTDLSVYYLYNDYQRISQSKQYSENKIFGINFRNDFNNDLLNVQLITDYEKNRINLWEEVIVDSTTIFSNLPYLERNLFSMSSNVSLKLLDGALITSVFGKLSSYSNKSIFQDSSSEFSANPFSIGFDLKYRPADFVELYFGYSIPKSYLNSDLNDNLIEVGGRINYGNINANIRYFRNDHTADNSDFLVTYSTKPYGNISGIGLNFDIKYSFLLLQSISSFYSSLDDKYLFGVPNFQTQTGLYYISKLFNDNLDLETGFVFYLTGKNNVYTYEHGVVEVPTSNKLDFTLVGEIQKTAIIYFAWQNLLNSNYYITPYYPMPTRTIRFGVAWEMFN